MTNETTATQLNLSENTPPKPGYKHTPLGWIPEEWKIDLLDNITKRGSGHTPDKEHEDYYNGGIKWISLADSYRLDQGVITDTEIEISEKGIKKSSAVLHPEGTVVMSRDAGVGKSAVMGTNMAVSQHFIAWTCNGEMHNWFLYYWLQSKKEYFERQAVGSTIKTIGLPFFKKLRIVNPPLPEQRQIAAILSTWDEAITKTQQLIAQLQQRNKGLMQQLLTGKKRLTGFAGEWRRLHLYEIAKEVVLKNRSGKDLTVLSCTKYDGLVPSLEYFGRRVFGSDTSTYKVVPLHHFAYATNHIEEGSIGYQNRFEEALISPMYTVFRTSESVHNEYLFKLLKSHQYIHEYRKRMEGSIDRRGGLRWDEFSKIIVSLPDTAEQVAISSLLNQVEKETSLHQQKLTALQAQKKGLMQKLLTGEVRVKTQLQEPVSHTQSGQKPTV